MTVRERLRPWWALLRWPFWLGLGLLIGFGGPYTWVLNQRVAQRFGDLEFSQPTRVYARPLALTAGTPMNAATLRQELRFADYTPSQDARVPGTWDENGDSFVIASRGYADPAGGELPRRVHVTLADGQVRGLFDLTARRPLAAWHLDPARIATLYGAHQEEREVVHLPQLPPLLVNGLQAVEDRDFNSHIGVDFSGIARALLADVRSGSLAQGGSTLTQQLVRNLFLDRNRTLVRKLNEALISVLITAHYSRGRILDAYMNEVYLGQQGGQAIHGFAAGSRYWFGRPLAALRPQEIALLVGLVRGPSYYDPRRYPERALQQRNLVLHEFHETGLITRPMLAYALAAPLGVTPVPRLPRDRFPAFMDLVRRQLQQDFSAQRLRAGALAVYTTLDPAAQLDAEDALDETLASFGSRGAALQGAVVVTDARSGAVRALVGGRDAGVPGFNRALDARRQIGSTIKPFAYLVALAQPQQWSLASLLDDAPITVPLSGGRNWTPQNDDHISHGQVLLVDALAHSYNQATVHLGMRLGLARIHRFLDSFGLSVPINPDPSLLLGAQDLSPYELAELYQFLASDGRAEPLRAVRGVLDANGNLLKRYDSATVKPEYQSAVRLLTWALQQVPREGTAHALGASPLGALNAAGKTGTSENQRDAWFAGYTGSDLAVVWVGRDDDKPTPLWGATGALPVWMRLFQRLPTRPLPAAPMVGLSMAWINPATGHRSSAVCSGARQLPFIDGYAPTEEDSCLFDQFKHWLDGPAPAGSG
ncbi:penicillin-binding protein 1B [Metallibacterium sp.]|uniref:penicillin-binding protein 1B n=1 Tax=Metallibacterium sp. TaxID=2940281 RepID=UPI0026375EE7|nr:penicillin-binding protein 1B [Metallibacterium sp.]